MLKRDGDIGLESRDNVSFCFLVESLMIVYLEECALFAFREDHKRNVCFKMETAVREDVIKGLGFHHFLSGTNICDAYTHAKYKYCHFRLQNRDFVFTSIEYSTLGHSTLVHDENRALGKLKEAAMQIFLFGFWTKRFLIQFFQRERSGSKQRKYQRQDTR